MSLEHLQHALDNPLRLQQVRFADARAKGVGPDRLFGLDVRQGLFASGGERQQFCALMGRVVLVTGQAIGLEQVGQSLNRLAAQTQNPGDLGDGERRIGRRGQHLPSRAGLTERLGQGVARLGQIAGHPKHADRQS